MSAETRLRAVVFDLDGLIFNTEELYQFVGEELLRRRDKTFPPELLDQTMGRPQRIALQLMIDWHQLDVSVDQLMIETAEVFATILGERLALMPGVLQLLAALEQAAIPKAIATSSNREFVLDVLGRFELTPRFKFILTGEDITRGKPHPEIYQLAAERFRLKPAKMMVLEDSRHGCAAAVAAGAFAVAVPAGRSHTQDFPGAALVADTLLDPRIYGALGLRPPAT